MSKSEKYKRNRDFLLSFMEFRNARDLSDHANLVDLVKLIPTCGFGLRCGEAVFNSMRSDVPVSMFIEEDEND